MSRENRRAVLAGTAAIVPAAAIAGVPALAEPDPIFAAIEAHRQAEAHLLMTCDAIDHLHDSLPEERRQSSCDGEMHIVEGDDPRWIAALRANLQACHNVKAVEETFLDIEPTTIAGVVALLRYSCNYSRQKGLDLVEGQYEEEAGESISAFALMHQNLADAIERITGAAS